MKEQAWWPAYNPSTQEVETEPRAGWLPRLAELAWYRRFKKLHLHVRGGPIKKHVKHCPLTYTCIPIHKHHVHITSLLQTWLHLSPPCMANSVCNWTQALTHQTRKQTTWKAYEMTRLGGPRFRHPSPTDPCFQTCRLDTSLHIRVEAHSCFRESSFQAGDKSEKSCEWDYRTDLPRLSFPHGLPGLTNTTFPCHVDRSENLALVVKFSLMPGS